MQKSSFEKLRLELSVQAKNGIDFIVAATVIWLIIVYIWKLPFTAYDRSILTFIVGTGTIPLAWVFSKVLKTNWKVEGNPLEPLGLWLNFAQLFYFPFLVFILLQYPDYFIMTYAIITGAHFFPYAWYYKTKAYAIMAGIISVGAMVLGLLLSTEKVYLIPLFMAGALFILAFLLYAAFKQNEKNLKAVAD